MQPRWLLLLLGVLVYQGRQCMSTVATRRRYAKISEAADYLGVTERTIRQMIADGRLRAYRNGRNIIRLDLNEIDAAMTPFGGAA